MDQDSYKIVFNRCSSSETITLDTVVVNYTLSQIPNLEIQNQTLTQNNNAFLLNVNAPVAHNSDITSYTIVIWYDSDK